MKFWNNSHVKQGRAESSGPVGFTLAVKHLGLEKYAKPQYIFYPIHPYNNSYLLDDCLHKSEMLAPMLKNCYAIHFFNEIWRRNGYDKNGAFHPNSPFEILKNRYLPKLNNNT